MASCMEGMQKVTHSTSHWEQVARTTGVVSHQLQLQYCLFGNHMRKSHSISLCASLLSPAVARSPVLVAAGLVTGHGDDQRAGTFILLLCPTWSS